MEDPACSWRVWYNIMIVQYGYLFICQFCKSKDSTINVRKIWEFSSCTIETKLLSLQLQRRVFCCSFALKAEWPPTHCWYRTPVILIKLIRCSRSKACQYIDIFQNLSSSLDLLRRPSMIIRVRYCILFFVGFWKLPFDSLRFHTRSNHTVGGFGDAH